MYIYMWGLWFDLLDVESIQQKKTSLDVLTQNKVLLIDT